MRNSIGLRTEPGTITSFDHLRQPVYDTGANDAGDCSNYSGNVGLMSKHVQCALAALAACVLGSIVIGVVALAEWLAPSTPALALIVAALIPAVLGGLMMAAPSDEQKWSRKLVLTGAIPGLIFGLIAIAIGAQWTQPSVRAMVVSALPTGFQDAKPHLRALDDPSAQVAVAACKQLAEPSLGAHRLTVLERLAIRPQVALACLQDSGGLPHHDEVMSLARTWHLRLYDTFDDEKSACELSEGLGAVSIDRASQAARLMRCSLQSRDEFAPACCAHTLQKHYPTASALETELAGTQDSLAMLGLGPQLLAAAFEGRGQIGTISLKTPAFQRLGLMAGCANLPQNPSVMIQALYSLSSSLKCMEADRPPPTSVEAWSQTCATMTRSLVALPDRDPSEVFCSSLVEEEERRLEMEREAQARRAVRNPELARLSSNIIAGHAQRSADEHESWRDLLAQRQRDVQDADDEEDRLLQREVDELFAILSQADDEPPDNDWDIPDYDEGFSANYREMVEDTKQSGTRPSQIAEAEHLLRMLEDNDLVPTDSELEP